MIKKNYENMDCTICCESTEDLIDFLGSEGKQLQVSSVLNKHFPFCFDVSFQKLVIDNKHKHKQHA